MRDHDAIDPNWLDNDSRRNYEIAHAALREQKIRAGTLTPRLDDQQECRWAFEGSVPVCDLDTANGHRHG